MTIFRVSGLLAVACGWLFTAGAAFAATPVFINELHYDNDGSDSNEAIEIAGPIGTDLSGWSLVLYNGSTGNKYATIGLSGSIAANCNGMDHGVVAVYPAQVQNGGPDGIALVDGASNVVQFLSYEGSFTANDGAASGKISEDIGVSESSGGSATESLQLTGSGSNYEDFTWTGPAAASFSGCNAGQSFPPPGAAVFVNELHYDDDGSDSNEGVEIAGPVGTDLTGWSVVLYNGSIGSAYDTINLSGTIPANCSGMDHGVVMGYPTSQIQNGGPDGLALVDGTGHVVQLLSYEGSFTANDGAASGTSSEDIGVSESSGGSATESLQLTGSGSNYEDFTWTGPATASFGTCNAGQSFPTSIDNPPAVASTLPADTATGVASAANVEVHFSEPVDLAAGWAELSCATSGSHPYALSGSDADYALDPTAAFANSETCSITVHAAKVADRDGNADAMTADYGFSFTTAADDPPEVLSTTPADNATTSAGGNLAVAFSEPVTVTGTWFTLTCDTSGSHAASVSGGPASYALDPTADFTELENCSFTILASAVADQDGAVDAMAVNAVVHFSIAGTGGNYYAGVDTSSGPLLEASLHDIIKVSTAFPYTAGSTDTWDIMAQADEDPANPANVLDVYHNHSGAKISGGMGWYNREHTWPNSLGFPNREINGQPNPPYTDMHMLHASDVDYNSARGNKPYGECPTTSCVLWVTENNGGFGGAPGDADDNWKDGPDGNQGTFEVWDHRKGDMARSILYMAVRYDGGTNVDGILEPDLKLTNTRSLIVRTDAQNPAEDPDGIAYMGLLDTLLQWHQADPPDNGERLRNDLVYSYQGNRNPFIDHPEWALCVFKNIDCPVANDPIFANGFESAAPP